MSAELPPDGPPSREVPRVPKEGPGGGLVAVLNWRPKTPVYYGWVILAMGALGTFVATGVSQVVLGGIQGFILDDMGWKRSTLALGVTIGTWSSGLMAPVVGKLTDRYGPRWLMPIGLIAAGVALLSLSGISALWQFYGAYILGRAVSNPTLIGVVPRTAAVNFFRKRRNIALSLVSMARPMSGAINIQIISFIAVRYGWRNAYRYLGVLGFCLVVPMALIMRRRPEDIGLLPDGERPAAPSEAERDFDTTTGAASLPDQPATDLEVSWPAGEALRTGAFWLVASATVLGTMGASTIGFSMVPLLREEADLSTAQAAGVLSFSTFLALSNLGWGYLADRFTPRRCLLGVMVCSSGIVLYLFTVSSLPMAYVFGALWGTFTGSIGALEMMVLAQYFGRGSYGTITGALAPMQMTALGIGPSLGALSRDVTGSYREIDAAMVGVYLIAALCIFMARPPRRRSESLPTESEK